MYCFPGACLTAGGRREGAFPSHRALLGSSLRGSPRNWAGGRGPWEAGGRSRPRAGRSRTRHWGAPLRFGPRRPARLRATCRRAREIPTGGPFAGLEHSYPELPFPQPGHNNDDKDPLICVSEPLLRLSLVILKNVPWRDVISITQGGHRGSGGRGGPRGF